MEEGSLRCDANISVRLNGEKEFGTKTEIKNMNSFRNVEKAIEYEIKRQIELIEGGEKVVQQTLLWNADVNESVPMRSKEEAHDYRYFPDPDLLPVFVDDAWEKNILKNLPELPDEKLNRFVKDFSLSVYDSEILTQSKNLSEYYENIISVTDDYKTASNWVISEVLSVINEKKIDISDFPVTALNLGKLINLIKNDIISSKIAKEVFTLMLENDVDPEQIVKEKNLIQISDSSEIETIIKDIFIANPKQVQEYRSGKEKVFGFFVGQVMRESKGKANPKIVNEILRKMLSNN
jgi:aspartyl-tRNA(Asn)/glutamyl-tRNA(Gln) amidotransferase subunit B